jgi:AGZA family xanthine/uracil permease-like MFS transporter
LEVNQARPALRTEIIAGMTTFLTAAYVIIVNPSIVADAGIPFAAGVTATVLVSFIGSCAMGLYARSPILVAPGMGINALFTYTIVLGMHVPLETALGCTLLAGIAFAVLALGDARSRLVAAVPPGLRYGVSAGIGLFLSFLGLIDARFVVSDSKTLVAAGAFDACVLTFLAGLVITIALVVRKVPGSLMIGMIVTTLLATPIGRLYGDGSAYGGGPTVVNWTGWVAAPDFSFIGRVDLLGACKLAYLPVVFVLLFTNFIEAMSTFMALAEVGNLKDSRGLPRNIKQTMHVDALSALLSGPLGTSPAVAYLESAAGIAQGGRSGLVAIVCGLMFLPFMFLSPLLSLVPSIATAPTLVMVGIFMMECVGRIRWDDMEEAIPAFVAILLIPLSYSMTLGISLAFITHVLLQIIKGKARGVPAVMWVTAGLSVLLIVQLKAG